MSIIKIVNTQTGEEIEREMTAEEIDPSLTWSKEQKAAFELEQQKQLQKTQARNALLDKLGITEEEARLLLS